MKAIALILLILGAVVCYGDGTDIVNPWGATGCEYWNQLTEDQKIEACFYLTEGFLGTMILVDSLADSYEGANDIDSLEKKMYFLWVARELLVMLPPDTTRIEYAREIMYRIELQYLQEECRELSLANVFARAVIETRKKTLE